MATSWRQQYLRYRKYLTDLVTLYKRRRDLRMYMELLMSLAAIVIFALFALRPTFLTIAQLIRDIKAKNATIDQMDEKIQNLATAQSTYNQRSTDISVLKLAVPSAPSPETFARQIEGVAQKDQVVLLGTSMGKAVLAGTTEAQKEDDLPPGAVGLEVSISATGSYDSLATFLTDLENMRRPIKTDSLSVSATQQDQPDSTIVLVLTGRIPYTK